MLNVPRSGVENTIGIWKGRFPWLRNIRMRIRNRQSMIKLIKYVYATIILHNLCVKTPYINDWITDESNSDSESEDVGLLHDGLNIRIDADEDISRRRSVHNYLYHKLLS
jgi:hypothetical protein